MHKVRKNVNDSGSNRYADSPTLTQNVQEGRVNTKVSTSSLDATENDTEVKTIAKKSTFSQNVNNAGSNIYADSPILTQNVQERRVNTKISTPILDATENDTEVKTIAKKSTFRQILFNISKIFNKSKDNSLAFTRTPDNVRTCSTVHSSSSHKMGPQQASTPQSLQSRGMVDLQNDLELHVSRIKIDSTRVDGFVDEENKSECSMSSESDIDFNIDGAPRKSMGAGGLRKNTDDHDDVSNYVLKVLLSRKNK